MHWRIYERLYEHCAGYEGPVLEALMRMLRRFGEARGSDAIGKWLP